MKLHFPWALDLRIWQGCFTDMIIPALFYRRFAFVTKLLLPRFRKLLTRRALSGYFAILKVKEILFSHSSSSNLHVYYWPFETLPQKIDLLCSSFTVSYKVKTRNAGKWKEDSIISAWWSEVLYVVLLSREQTRKCTRLDGSILGSWAWTKPEPENSCQKKGIFEQNLNTWVLCETRMEQITKPKGRNDILHAAPLPSRQMSAG